MLDLELCSTNGSDPDKSHLTFSFLICKMGMSYFIGFMVNKAHPWASHIYMYIQSVLNIC